MKNNSFEWPTYDLITGFGRTDAHNKTGNSLVVEEQQGPQPKQPIEKKKGTPYNCRKAYYLHRYIESLPPSKREAYMKRKREKEAIDKPIFSNLPL